MISLLVMMQMYIIWNEHSKFNLKNILQTKVQAANLDLSTCILLTFGVKLVSLARTKLLIEYESEKNFKGFPRIHRTSNFRK